MPTPLLPLRGRRSFGIAAMAVIGCGALLLGACGGDDDDADADSSTTTTVAGATTTIAAATTTTPPTTTTTLPPLDLVTEGATVVVANASGINGAAGRMSDALAAVGFTTGDATNSSEGQLETTKIYYDPANEQAKPVADSLREALGAGDIEVLELVVPAPTESGELGDATVLVAMGNDTADKSLDELQGRVAPAEDTADDSSGEETSSEPSGDDTTTDQSDEESSSEPSGDDTTTDQSDEQTSDG